MDNSPCNLKYRARCDVIDHTYPRQRYLFFLDNLPSPPLLLTNPNHKHTIRPIPPPLDLASRQSVRQPRPKDNSPSILTPHALQVPNSMGFLVHSVRPSNRTKHTPQSHNAYVDTCVPVIRYYRKKKDHMITDSTSLVRNQPNSNQIIRALENSRVGSRYSAYISMHSPN